MEQEKKMVFLRPTTHQQVKVLAAESRRKINNDLIDDLVLLGIEEYRRTEKILKRA